ncbi:MAG: VOC family protein [Spirulinaceae cyanobacterium]
MRILTNICSDDLPQSKAFYVELLGLRVKYDSDWYVQLCSPDDPDVEYGIIERDHELVPAQYRQVPTGMYVTFVVADVEATYQKAQELGLPILQEPRNEFYGQRRFLTQDPNGCLIDVCSPWEG